MSYIGIEHELGRTPANVWEAKCEAQHVGKTGMFFSTLAVAVGAVLYWAVTSQGHGFRISTVGVILMVVGAVGFVTSSIIFATSRRTTGSRPQTYDREATDAQGGTTVVHEEVR